MKDIEHVEMSGWFMLQPHGESLNKDGFIQPTQPCQTIQPITEHVTRGACHLHQ